VSFGGRRDVFQDRVREVIYDTLLNMAQNCNLRKSDVTKISCQLTRHVDAMVLSAEHIKNCET
jgi:hypothetical protein